MKTTGGVIKDRARVKQLLGEMLECESPEMGVELEVEA